MHGRKPNQAEERRFLAIHDRGCVPCFLERCLKNRRHEWVPEPCDIHHVEQASKCGHHMKTYGCCPWHHRGLRKNDLPLSDMKITFGPSMALHPREYRERYGDETSLLQLQAVMMTKTPEELRVG